MKALKIIEVIEISLCAALVIILVYSIKQTIGYLPTIEAGKLSEKLFGTDILNASLPFIPRIADAVSTFLLTAIIVGLFNQTKKIFKMNSADGKNEDFALGILAGLSAGIVMGLALNILELIFMPNLVSLILISSIGITGSFVFSCLSTPKCGLGFCLAFGPIAGLITGLFSIFSQGITIGLILAIGFSLISATGILASLLFEQLASEMLLKDPAEEIPKE